MHAAQDRPHYLDDLLLRLLREFLGEIDADALALMRQHLHWVELPGGEALVTQGEPGDALYLLVSGRLRTYITDDDGVTRIVREVARGEIVGEMSLFTGEPRSATLVAIRDSVLVRLGQDEFNRLLAISPQVSVALTRQIIDRLRSERGSVRDQPVTMGLLPITAGVDVVAFGRDLAQHMGRAGRVAVVDSASLDAALGSPGITHRDGSDAQANRRIAVQLDEIEAAHDFVLLLADDAPTPWTQRCVRHCDELLLLADARQPPVLHAIETQCILHRPPRTEATQVLVLLHPTDQHMPQHTAAWLGRRPLADHVHVRPALARDMARLARLQTRTAVGLVLAGGGARGFAHLGTWRALQEQGIEVDVVGGTSMGAVMATFVASDQPLDRVMTIARQAFRINPTGDFNLLPLMSLIKGRRLRRIIEQAAQQLLGGPADVEDVWKNLYAVATNYSQASEHLLQHGPLVPALLASIAIPGALPPVIADGDLLCDGGTFNNFPVDVMRRMRGVGQVIGVDLNARAPKRIEHPDVPGTWALLRDRLRPRPQRRYRLPSLAAYLMNVTILYSVSRQRQARKLTDLYFNPPLERMTMLQWSK
ncbi:MAG: patatin, partial [Burkholderiales bacterium PBB5]